MAKKRKDTSSNNESLPFNWDDLQEIISQLDESTIHEMCNMFEGLAHVSEEDLTDDFEDEVPQTEAEELVQAAREMSNFRAAKELAEKAIACDPDCDQAYVLLAEISPSHFEAITNLKQARSILRKKLGDDFEKLQGVIGFSSHTRPYLNVQYELANSLWEEGYDEEAVAEFQEYLRLNENDNHGARYNLATCYLALERHDDLEVLLKRYPDENSPFWSYSKALLQFRLVGDTPAARSYLQEAEECNPFVPPFLVGNKLLPMETPDYYQPGQENEAIWYAGENFPNWRSTPGAIPWMRNCLKLPFGFTEPSRYSPSSEKIYAFDYDLNTDVIWEVDVSRIENYNGQGDSTWISMVVEADTGFLRASQLYAQTPTDAEIWDVILTAIAKPEWGDPERPGVLRVRTKTRLKRLKNRMEKLEIRGEQVSRLEWYNEALPTIEATIRRSAGSYTPDESVNTADLPIVIEEIWQLDVTHMPMWIQGEGEMIRPYLLLLVSSGEGTILTQNILEQAPDEQDLHAILLEGMQHPAAGSPRRPARVHFRQAEWFDTLESFLNEYEVTAELTEELDFWDFLVSKLPKELPHDAHSSPQCTMPGMTPEQLEQFYTVSRMYYLAKPWKKVHGSQVFKVTTKDLESQPWFGIVMGQSGMELGIALYENQDELTRLLGGSVSEEDVRHGHSALGLTFDEAFTLAAEDINAIEKHGWPIANPEAYPYVMRIQPGPTLRGALNWELALLEGSMTGVVRMIDENLQSTSCTVSFKDRQIHLQLCWM